MEGNMDQFDVVKMASGGLALVLEATSTWDEFPAHAEKWTRRLNARSLSKPVITVDECIAEVAIASGEFWITYDDFQSSIQLETKNQRYNDIVMRLQAEFRDNARSRTPS
jgi:hypothetical protein